MAVYSGPEIVNNGLVLHLDAANSRSYPGSGTTWYDLSGRGHHASLFNSPTPRSNYIAFDGTNQRGVIDFQTINTNDLYAPAFTLIGMVRQTSASTTDGWLLDLDYVGYRIVGSTNAAFYVRGPAISWSGITFSSFSLNNWYHVAATFIDDTSTNNANVYINGTLASQSTFGQKNIGAYGSSLNVALCSHWNGGNPKPYDVGLIQKYNRVLSAAEIKQNFEATRTRYGV